MEQKYFSKIIFLFGFLTFLSSCSLTQRLPDDEYYLKSNTYTFSDTRKYAGELEEYVKQKPNIRILGIVPVKDWAYNEIPQIYDSMYSTYFEFPKKVRNQYLRDSLYRVFGLEKEIGENHFWKRQLYRWGEKPITLDSLSSYNSAKELEQFYKNRGYFKAQVHPQITIDSTEKKAQVDYEVTLNRPSYISSYNQMISDAEIEKIYAETASESKVEIGQQFDVRNMESERDRISSILKNRGYYHFNESGYDLIFRVDTAQIDSLKVSLKIKSNTNDSIAHFQPYRFGKVEIYTQETKEDSSIKVDTLYKAYRLLSKEELAFKPRFYTDAVTIKEGEPYSAQEVNRSRKLLLDRSDIFLNSLRTEKVEEDSLIVTRIFTRQKEKYDLELSLETMYSAFLNLGFSPGISLLSRNVFGGGEDLSFNVKGLVGTVNSEKNSIFNAYEISFSSQLDVPRWLLPFDTEGLFPKHFNPKSSFSLGVSQQKNIGLGSRNYSTLLNYKITPEHRTHLFNLIDIQYINNTEKDSYYDIFTQYKTIRDNTLDYYFEYNPQAQTDYENGNIDSDQLELNIYNDNVFANSLPYNDYTLEDYTTYRNMIFNKLNAIQDVLIQSFAYEFTLDENQKKGEKNPFYLRTRVELAGVFPRLADKLMNFEKKTDNFGKEHSYIGGVAYSEFLKIDLDLRKTFQLTPKTSLAFHSFTGVGYSYGNSELLPFNRSYFGGGVNDVRAWRAYELSPDPIAPNDGGIYVDDIKITWSAEYRYPISGMLKGALFADAGNIWSLDSSNPSTQFKFNKFISQMGLGAGFGLRYDFDFIIARLDFAYKIHNPAYKTGSNWFRDLNVFSPRIQFGINYPF